MLKTKLNLKVILTATASILMMQSYNAFATEVAMLSPNEVGLHDRGNNNVYVVSEKRILTRRGYRRILNETPDKKESAMSDLSSVTKESRYTRRKVLRQNTRSKQFSELSSVYFQPDSVGRKSIRRGFRKSAGNMRAISRNDVSPF